MKSRALSFSLSVPYSTVAKRGAMFVLAVLGLTLSPLTAFSVPFTVTFNWPDSFRIYGHQLVPQVNGFDYYFTPEQISSDLAGHIVHIHSFEVSGYGHNLGDVINFDWEVHLSADDIGLPEGQFLQILVDPASGYSKNNEKPCGEKREVRLLYKIGGIQTERYFKLFGRTFRYFKADDPQPSFQVS